MMRPWRAITGGVFLFVSPAACMNLEDPAPSSQPILVVHAVLDTWALSRNVLVYRARTGARDTNAVIVAGDEPVAGALVTITPPNGSPIAAARLADSSGACCVPGEYLFNSGLVLIPGGTYSLHVRTASGEEVSATTTIPQAPQLMGLAVKDFLRLRDTLRLSWPRVPGARSYEVILSSRSLGLYRTFTDTTVVLPGTTLTLDGDMVFPAGDRVGVLISAVDANYYDYYRAQSDPFAGVAPSHLTGAVGVFGSIAPILVTALEVR